MQQTSIEAYIEQQQLGKINTDQARVFQAVKQYSPCTAHELAQRSGINYFTIQRRLSELESRKLIFRKTTIKCPISGRRSLVIDLA